MSSTVEILQAICPALYESTQRSVFVNLAELSTDATYFGSNRPLAVALRAAHQFTLTQGHRAVDGASGPVTSKSEGPLSIGYGSVSGVKGDLSQTVFGVQLHDLIHRQGGSMRVIGSSISSLEELVDEAL